MSALLYELGLDYSLIEDVVAVIILVWGIPLIIIGICEAFFGYKILKIIRGIVGGFCGGLFGFLIGVVTQLPSGDSSDYYIAGAICAVVFAAAGAVINVLLLYAGVFLTTWIVTGVIFSILFHSVPAGVVVGLLLAIVSIFIFKYSIIIFTAVDGGIMAGNALGRVVSAFQVFETSSEEDLFGYLTGQKSTSGTLISIVTSVLLIMLGLWLQIRRKKKDAVSGKTATVRKYVPYTRYVVCAVVGAAAGIVTGMSYERFLPETAMMVTVIALLGGMFSRKRNWLLTGSWACGITFLILCIASIPQRQGSYSIFRGGYYYSAAETISMVLCIISLILAGIIAFMTALGIQNDGWKERFRNNRYLEFIMKYGNRVNAAILGAIFILMLPSGSSNFNWFRAALSALLFGITESSIFFNRYYHRNRKYAKAAASGNAGNRPTSDSYDPAVDLADRVQEFGSRPGETRRGAAGSRNSWYGRGQEQSGYAAGKGQDIYDRGKEYSEAGSRAHGFSEDRSGSRAAETEEYAFRDNRRMQMTLDEAFGPELSRVAAKVLTEGDHGRIRYMPRDNQDGSWMCTCGNENGAGEEYCMYCGASRTEMKEKLNYRFLSAAAAQIREQEKAEQEAEEQRRAAEQKEKERRRAEEQKDRERRRKEDAARMSAAFREQADRQKEQIRHAQREAGRQTSRAKKKFRRFLRRHPLVIPIAVVILIIIIIICAVLHHVAGERETTASYTAASYTEESGMASSDMEGSSTATSLASSSGTSEQDYDAYYGQSADTGTENGMTDTGSDAYSGYDTAAGNSEESSAYASDTSPEASVLNTSLSMELAADPDVKTEDYAISSVQASSVLDGYPASNLIDDDPATAWVEGDAGLGIGTTLTIQLSSYQDVTGIEILDGYLKSEDIATKNARASRIGISAGGYYGEIELPYPSPLYETFLQNSRLINNAYRDEYFRRDCLIQFTNPSWILTDQITITILDGVSGTKYDDLAISEINVF